jgi:hypothetical protein
MYFAEKHQYILISREEDEIRRLQEKIRVLELENKNLLTKNTELTSQNSVLLNKIRDSENDKKKFLILNAYVGPPMTLLPQCRHEVSANKRIGT